MSRDDWFSTSRNTNIAESAHAQGQREGVKLTLISAVRLGIKMDKRFFEAKTGVQSFGVSIKRIAIARKKDARKEIEKEKERTEAGAGEDVLAVAQDLVKAGADKDIVNRYLNCCRLNNFDSVLF
jgi:hypothetical protein